MDTKANVSIFKPTYRYWSHNICIQDNISILKPTYRNSNHYIDTQANLTILKPTYRNASQRIDNQGTISILKSIYRYSRKRIDTRATISILKPQYRYSNHNIDTRATISILKPQYRYRVRDVDEAGVFKTMFCDVVSIDVTVLLLCFRRSPYLAFGNAELSERKHENSLTELTELTELTDLMQFLISQTHCRFLYSVFVFLTRWMNVTLATVLLVHVSIVITVRTVLDWLMFRCVQTERKTRVCLSHYLWSCSYTCWTQTCTMLGS
jgi:hypothetical protein